VAWFNDDFLNVLNNTQGNVAKGNTNIRNGSGQTFPCRPRIYFGADEAKERFTRKIMQIVASTSVQCPVQKIENRKIYTFQEGKKLFCLGCPCEGYCLCSCLRMIRTLSVSDSCPFVINTPFFDFMNQDF
jgi:hypothetical protein